MKKEMAINRNLSLKGCWRMVNNVDEIWKANIAEEWLTNNDVITNEEYDELMIALSYLVREIYRNR